MSLELKNIEKKAGIETHIHSTNQHQVKFGLMVKT